MQSIFDEYSKYYDLLYEDKDYAAEAEYVANVLEKNRKGLKSLLEFGSGTGRHARLFARRGWEVAGVERSETMAARAREERAKGSARDKSIRWVSGDIRDVCVSGRFDAVVSLFHVVSYQTTNEDVSAVFDNATRHLDRGGVFLFDIWYAPAVLTQIPTVRIKRVQDERIELTRIAEPTLNTSANCVQVNYTLFVKNRADGCITSLSESHHMRYFSTPEIDLFCRSAGLVLLHAEEWLTGREPGPDTWGVCYVAKKAD